MGEALNISCYKLYEEILKGNKNIKNQVALADRNSEMAKNNHDKLEKFIMDIK